MLVGSVQEASCHRLSGEQISTNNIHCTQQLNFLGNCQCKLNLLYNMHIEARAQVPIFDTYHTIEIFVNCGYLDIVTLFGGSLKHKRGILGQRIALLTFNNDYDTFWGIFIITVSQLT